MMLIESDGLVATLGQRADDDGGYVAATGSEVEGVGFVKDARIGGAERAIVRVIAKMGDDEGIVGEVCRVQIGGELTEGHEVLHLLGIVLHVGEIGKRIVADGVTAGVVAGVADSRKDLRRKTSRFCPRRGDRG